MVAPAAISFTATATIDLGAKADDGPDPLPTFAIKGYTGASMNIAGFYSPVIVDLNGLKASSGQIPALLNHDIEKIVGQTSGISIGASGVDLSGVLTGGDEDPNVRKIKVHARNGFKWQASIGADVVRREFLESGKKATVNGREISGPHIIVRESALKEISFTPIGADDQTSATVAASISPGLHNKEPNMQFQQWLEARGIDPASLTDPIRAELQARFDSDTAPKPDGPLASFDSVVSKHEEEIERRNKITAFLDGIMADRPDLVPELKKLGQMAFEAGAKFDDVERQVYRLERKVGRGGTLVRDTRRVASKMIEATVARSCGLANLEKHYNVDTLNASDEAFPHGIGLRDLLLCAARENGYSGFSTSDPRALLQAAFRSDARPMIRADAEFSTVSLPGIMSNVANKFLVQGFNSVESAWREIAAITSSRDFKTFYSYSFILDAAYEKVGPTGELSHATASEIEYTNRVATYGKMFAVTREHIINDNLGALSEIPMKLGRGAAVAFNVVFWTQFLADLNTFYTSGRGNVSTGAGSALSSAGLSAAELAFLNQTDPNGDPLGVDPKILLVPPALNNTADELMTSTAINTGGAATETKVPNRNIWQSKFKKVMSRYLSNANITGYSSAAWWLIADPMDLPLIQAAFLNGRQEPVVESADADFNALGVQFRGYYDFGVAKQEYRAAVRSAGS